ncbi:MULTISPECIES: MarR family winged helix-turn-helix transcriptional regulator [unclassified Haematobacter]|uniref:MarR family winged helix-turn-helix transcriptional regulator n=1 Tax=unclassified Haematobacter TaxID=2640585 RepID=UPI0025C338B9|nr:MULTISPECIES: MarR family winged helix-turn-helix transcriptional regulator [unclassified Haematobacter]
MDQISHQHLPDAPDRGEPFDLARCIGAITTSLSNKLSSGASHEYRRLFDFGVVEWRVLCQLAAEPWSIGAHLSNSIGLDKASISRSLSLLADRGLIEMREGDGRRREAALTEAGWAMHRQVLTVARAREAALLTGFSGEEVNTLLSLLNRLLANLPEVEADGARRMKGEK